MSPLYFLYVTAGLAGLGAGSHLRRARRPAVLVRVVASGGLLVTGLIGVLTLFTGSQGGPLASIGWLLLGWTLGVWLEDRGAEG
jgi:hypothetical protein